MLKRVTPQMRAPCQQPALYAFPAHAWAEGLGTPARSALQLAHPHQLLLGAPLSILRPDTQKGAQLGTEGGLTGKGDVEAPLSCGVVSLELETGHMAAAGDGGGELVSWEGPEDWGLSGGPILDDQKVKLRLHVNVVEGQVDAALRPGQDEPDTVEVVAIVLRVVGWQDDPGGAGEVEEAGNCKRRAAEVSKRPWHSAWATEGWQGSISLV